METNINNGVMLPKKDGQMGDAASELNLVKASGDAIPREPERSKLKGHRARITKV